jgi:hypothetical protein
MTKPTPPTGQEPQTLAHALHGARAALAAKHPPPALQTTVLAALPAPRANAGPVAWLEERVLGWVIAGGQVRQARIAAFAVVIGVLAGGAALLLGQAAHTGARAINQQVATAFIPLVSAERMGKQNLGWVVATDMPRANLAALGLPYDPGRAGDTVRAEMLVNPAGEVLAVRFMQ